MVTLFSLYADSLLLDASSINFTIIIELDIEIFRGTSVSSVDIERIGRNGKNIRMKHMPK